MTNVPRLMATAARTRSAARPRWFSPKSWRHMWARCPRVILAAHDSASVLHAVTVGRLAFVGCDDQRRSRAAPRGLGRCLQGPGDLPDRFWLSSSVETDGMFSLDLPRSGVFSHGWLPQSCQANGPDTAEDHLSHPGAVRVLLRRADSDRLVAARVNDCPGARNDLARRLLRNR